MKKLKRFLAGFLCLCMIVSTGNFTSVAKEFAFEQQEKTSETDKEIIGTGTDAISEGIDSETNLDNQQLSYIEEVATETDAVQEILLNYLVIGSDYIETPDTQFILANIGDGTMQISSAVLTYINQTTEAVYQVSADVIDGASLLFNLSFTDEKMSGIYKATSIDFIVDGKVYTISLSDAGIEAVFGVNKDVATQPDAWVVDEETADLLESGETNEGIIITDGDNNPISAADLEEAISEVSANNTYNTYGVLSPIGNSAGTSNGGIIVVLDPGHGGTDVGATHTWNGVTYYERDINLKIAKYCKEELEKYAGITVYMTRTDNVSASPSVYDRAQYGKDHNADILVSIHINSTSSSTSTATGSEVYIPNANYNPKFYEPSKELAEMILAELKKLGLANRGAKIWNTVEDEYPDGSKHDYLGINRYCKLLGYPGILIEHAFINNPSDVEKYFSSDEKIKSLGVADATAIASYFGLSTSPYIYGGVDYSAVFDFDYYINRYPDIKKAYGSNVRGALEHFVLRGMKEGRQGCETFDVYSYKNAYADLRSAFEYDLTQYYMHYISHGKSEGRIATGVITLQKPITIYRGVDYSSVYNYEYYVKKYPDIKSAFGNDDIAVLKHFINNGMKEGRWGCDSFDVSSYKNAYRDLRLVFGDDLPKYYMHYISKGKNEGRITTGISIVQNPISIYNGVDYSAVYDYDFYVNTYPDIKKVFGNDDIAVLRHFVNTGMKEGRQGCKTFNVQSYRYNYQDLRKAFGLDYQKYYMHYLSNGKREGRIATGITTLQNPVTTYNGVDYSLVYDFNYYIANNSTVKAKYSNDDVGALKYFVETGVKNGDVANSKFNIVFYKINYNDLTRVFGNNNAGYYAHYIKYGVKEGRIANRILEASVANLTGITGTTTTTVNQMVRYYKANATYPAYYAGSDAPTIEAFCQLYIEECNAEGIRAEVAFCQAMKETGFLRFGGAVTINQYNFAGIGATDSGGIPASFATVREGIRAQVQHLKAYASEDSLKNACVDPRFSLVTRGCAPYVEWLGINENPYGKGWASAQNYGYSIINDYMLKLYKY